LALALIDFISLFKSSLNRSSRFLNLSPTPTRS
jgi:hypothetical protein